MDKTQTIFSVGIVCFLFCTLPSCVSNPSKPQESRVFYQNGKEIKISQQQLFVIRKRLDKEYLNTTNSKLSIENLEIVKDYIAINEFVLSTDCWGSSVTKILTVERFNPKEHQHSKARDYKPNLHDEVWFVSSCGLKRNYRVYDKKDSTLIGVYPFLVGK